MPANSMFSGKYFSILGDSISTLKGFLPTYCKAFYMQNPRANCSGIARPADTWWIQVISAFEGNLCVNNSYSGSLVCGTEFPCATHPLRCGELHCNPGSYYYRIQNGAVTRILCTETILPEVILINMGTNDWIFHSLIDDKMESKKNFCRAYDSMLRKIKKRYPDSRIVCATIFQKDDAVPDALYPIGEYNNVIRQAAEMHGCMLADIAKYRDPIETIDGIHPTYQGMHTLASLWVRCLTDQK